MTDNFIKKAIMKYAEKNSIQFDISNDDFIITDNNDKIISILEKRNIEYGYCDEYALCSSCYNAIRTSPDSYSWKPDYFIGDGYISCKNCIDIKDYLLQLQNNPNNANTILSHDELIKEGYKKVNEYHYESGMHEGMNDDPHKILAELKNQYNDIIFSIYANSQFYTEFDVYAKNSEYVRF